MKSIIKIGLLVMLVLQLSACAGFGSDGRRGVSSSLVDYLYPEGQVPPKYEETIPHLRLPLTVGLAFVPSQKSTDLVLPEAKKMQLLEQVKQKFAGLDYVREINIIPDTYMRSTKGFEGVDQIARLYGLDVVALVSYDQVAVSSETKSSLLYWTIVGAYLIKGNQNEVTTFVDTAVFDVNSRKMLLRAPGVSENKRSSTLVEVEQVNRATRSEGFELAMADMSNNLAAELSRFKERIKQDKSVQVSRRQGYSGGGGALQWPLVMLLAGIALMLTLRRTLGARRA
ncbi:MAG: rhombotarget lipoprotein [Gammaproteobacteria bacterium]|nr:rhombotarget lipoprotein [Gammaproteobacteria bacterium]